MTLLRINVNPLKQLGEDLGKFSADRLAEVSRTALNDAGDNAYELGKTNILRGVNLSEPYVTERLRKQAAARGRLSYEITALGDRHTMLSHYGSMPEAGLVTVEVIRGSRKVVGRKPRLGFVIPGFKKDREGNDLIFRPTEAGGGSRVDNRPGRTDKRKPRKKIQALVGPSVYQLFRQAIPQISDDVGDDLAKRVTDYAQRELERVLG